VLGTTGLDSFAENTWAGWRLRIGEQVTLRILVATPRCAVPTLAQGRLPPDPAAMRVLAAHNRIWVPGAGLVPTAGVYADVLIPGCVRRGDPVRLLPATPQPQPAPARPHQAALRPVAVQAPTHSPLGRQALRTRAWTQDGLLLSSDSARHGSREDPQVKATARPGTSLLVSLPGAGEVKHARRAGRSAAHCGDGC
jgi:hypothetical protein